MSEPDEPVIDVWSNWWDSDFFRVAPDLSRLYRKFGMTERTCLDLSDLLAQAKSGNVSRIILSATAFPGSTSTNDVVAAVVDEAPELLVGCASVDPREGIKAVRALRQSVRVLNFRALKLLPYLYEKPPNHAIYFPLYAACVEEDVPVLILTGHTAVQQASEPGRPHYLDEVALHFPELTIIAGHAGFPWTQELISLAWKHDNVYIDTSGHRPKHFPSELVRYMDSYGRHKVLFGTGYPLMAYDDALKDLSEMALKPKTRRAFLHENARNIWGWHDH